MDLEHKFRDCAAQAGIDSHKACASMNALKALDDQNDVAEVVQLLLH
jgi:hypothetical protein